QNEDDAEGRPVQPSAQGPVFSPGDLIAFRIDNLGAKAVYPTLLFLDSGYGITALYPAEGEVIEVLPAGKSHRTGMLRVTGKTVGLEHVVLIAVRAGGQPVDFTVLEQPSLEQARKNALRGAGALETPLGRLLQNALYGAGTTRGLERTVLNEYA